MQSTDCCRDIAQEVGSQFLAEEVLELWSERHRSLSVVPVADEVWLERLQVEGRLVALSDCETMKLFLELRVLGWHLSLALLDAGLRIGGFDH